jgi:hypothetical protein
MLLDELEVRPRLTGAKLDALHRRRRADANYTRTIAEAVASGSAELERAGAWLLRREATERGGYPADDWAVVVDALPGVRTWAGRLLLCQLCSAQPSLMDAAPDVMAVFLRDCSAYPKPTVRAWAVSSLHELARRHGEYRAEARRLVRRGRLDPAPCVRARMRHLH